MSSAPAFDSKWFAAITRRPIVVVAIWLVLLLPAIAGLQFFRLDASSDSIVLDDDPALRFYDDTRLVFGGDSVLVVVIRPEGDSDIFSSETLERIEQLAQRLEKLPGVESVLSVGRVPLFLNPPSGLFNLADGYRTIRGDEVDLDLAREEVNANPLYAGALVSKDGRSTALQISLTESVELQQLEQERYGLRDTARERELEPEERSELDRLEVEVQRVLMELADGRRELIASMRTILAAETGLGQLDLGGLPMITVDIVRFIERDLVLFGAASVVFVLLVVWLLFRSLAWTVAISLNCCLTVLALLGLLGWMDWRITVVTSNLSSLLFILTLAVSVHIAIRYLEERARQEAETDRGALAEALSHVLVPSIFTVLTTMIGFGSLYMSNLKPVMDFSLMMGMGLSLTFVLSFSLLPNLVLLFPSRWIASGRGSVVGLGSGRAGTARGSWYVSVAQWALAKRRSVLVASVVLLTLGLVGVSRLGVENSFVDYFKESSQIHQGLTAIDEQLGGTTPLEVVFDSGEPDGWLDMQRIGRLRELHGWLEEQPELGHVTSLDSLISILEQIIAADPTPALRSAQVNSLMLRMIRSRVPPDIAASALKPYVSDDFALTRITARVQESTPDLDREALLARIEEHLDANPVVDPDLQQTTGMFVLYNNMLQSLLSSQISTLATVLGSIAVMFWLLLRNLRLTLIALVPNILPVVLVLGVLGWVGIPLDMMTIMIAAITLGISVDDTVHYLYRFRRESQTSTSTLAQAVCTSHDTVGRAMLATTVAVAFGFSTLTLSNFLPTVYFGLLTGLAMVTALLADALLLPAMLSIGKSEKTPGA